MQKKISVIVPAYNTEKWIGKCLSSILSSSYKNLELLVVDDGSTDKTGTIADEYAKKDTRVKVFHRKNVGVSASRNFAISISTGELISFIDSDDYIDSYFYEKLICAMVAENADMAISTRTRVFPDGSIESLNIAAGIWSINPANFRFNTMYSEFDWSISWNKLYRRELFANLNFPENMHYAEDLYLLTDIWRRVKRAVYVQEGLYYYRFNPVSASFDLSDEKLSHRILATKYALDFVIEKSPVNIPFLIDLLFGAYVSAYYEGSKKRAYLREYRGWFWKNIRYCGSMVKTWAFYTHPAIYSLLKRFK